MRALVIAAGLFFTIFGVGLAYFALSGTGHEYDLKLVLPIDTHQMPRPIPVPPVVSQVQDSDLPAGAAGGRAEAGPDAPVAHERIVVFPARPGSASEAPPQ